MMKNNRSLSMEFSDQLVKQCFQCAFNYYDCPKANLQFSNSNNYLAVQSPLSNSTWLIVAILGMIKAEYDLLFLDHQGQIIDFSMARQVKFVISSVDEDAMDSLLGACSF